ncbi:hypothetical protein EI94DRAFT_1739590, partial [Lactarius quietus]
FLDNHHQQTTRRSHELETWWVERQVALEAVGYMLRPRYRHGWTIMARHQQVYLDAKMERVYRRLGMDATRISDGRSVVLKRQLSRKDHMNTINTLFSTEPLASNPRNHCAHMLDVIQLPGDQPILVHPLLRHHCDPPFRTFGEFVTFFAQICEVCLARF